MGLRKQRSEAKSGRQIALWWLCVWVSLGGMGLLACQTPNKVVRRKQIEQFPQIPQKMAKAMMRQVLHEFRRSLKDSIEEKGNRPMSAPEVCWKRMVDQMKPLMVSLRSYELQQFRRTLKDCKNEGEIPFHQLPADLREEVSNLEAFASYRIHEARVEAMRSYRAAKAKIAEVEAMLNDTGGISRKALRGPTPPKRRVRHASGRRYPSLQLMFPLPNHRIGSGYGWRRGPISRKWGFHTGVDIGARSGRPILAVAEGVVLRAKWMGGCGYGVILRHHQFGYRRVTTTYCHMSRILVRPKQKVDRGQTIGLIGSTGNSTGPHLHFAVHINGRHVNPKHHLLAP